MATNLQIDDKLILKAVRLGGHKTKKEAVSKALAEYIHQLERSSGKVNSQTLSRPFSSSWVPSSAMLKCLRTTV